MYFKNSLDALASDASDGGRRRVLQVNWDNFGRHITFLLFIRTRSNFDTVRIYQFSFTLQQQFLQNTCSSCARRA